MLADRPPETIPSGALLPSEQSADCCMRMLCHAAWRHALQSCPQSSRSLWLWSGHRQLAHSEALLRLGLCLLTCVQVAEFVQQGQQSNTIRLAAADITKQGYWGKCGVPSCAAVHPLYMQQSFNCSSSHLSGNRPEDCILALPACQLIGHMRHPDHPLLQQMLLVPSPAPQTSPPPPAC